MLHALPLDNEHALFARAAIEVKPGGPSRLRDGEDVLLYSLQRANLRTGEAEMFREGAPATIDWIVDEAGGVIARIDQTSQSKKLQIMATDPTGRNATKVGEISSEDFGGREIFFFGAVKDARAFQVLKAEDGGGLAMYSYSLDAPGFGASLPAPAPLLRAIYDPRFGRARIGYYATPTGERAFHFDLEDQKAQAALEKALAGASVSLVSRSVDGARAIARADYADKPQEFYLYDKAAKRLELVAAN